MYAYVDETGNTGPNIFDKEQPFFITAALLTKINFDIHYKDTLRQIAANIGETELHANQLGEKRIEECASDLRALFKRCGARFFISRIEKSYLATSKLVDTLFDSYENKAVPWHIYNLRPLRLLMVFKIAVILTEETAKKFWQSILDTQEDSAYRSFLEALQDLKENLELLPDARSRELIEEAINWASLNPESIYIHTNARAARNGHLPNLAVFPNLLTGIDHRSRLWRRPVREIVHDRQNQFQNMLEEWHRLFSNAAPGELTWTMGEKLSVRRVAGSKFRISNSSDSPGIQSVDVILWLFKRVLQGGGLLPNSANLMKYVLRRAYHNDLSFDGIGNWLEKFFFNLYSQPLTDEQIRAATNFFKIAEERRQQAMIEYAEQKVVNANTKG
jgi:Protein of unknown function (DUF3800)